MYFSSSNPICPLDGTQLRKEDVSIILLKRIRQNLPLHSRIMFYNALINPHLLYCCTMHQMRDLMVYWNYKKELHRLYSVIIFQKLGWIPILNQIKMSKLLIVFNVLKNKAPSNLLDLFQSINDTHSVRIRSSLTDLKLPKVSSEIAKTEISYSGAMLFNSLPNNMKDVENISLQTFKNVLKTYFLNQKKYPI